MRRSKSQSEIVISRNEDTPNHSQNTGEEPALWGWFSDPTPLNYRSPRPLSRSQPSLAPIEENKNYWGGDPSLAPIEENKNYLGGDLSYSKFKPIDYVLGCCYTIFQRNSLDLTGIHPTSKPRKNNRTNHQEPTEPDSMSRG